MPSPMFIPGELTDDIIGFIRAPETSMLLACALVCRNWLLASRHRLFERIDITCTQYDLFLSRVVHSEAMQPWLSSVRYLALRDHRLLASREVHLRPEENGLRRSQHLLHDFIGRLPNLAELELVDADWIQRPPHPSSHHILRSSSIALPSLRRLSLCGHRFPSFSSLRRLLASLPRLEDLVLEDVQWPPAVHDLSSIVALSATSPALVALIIWTDMPDGCIDNLLTWLAHTPYRKSVRELRFDTIWTDRHVAFLRVVAPHLTTLSLQSLDSDRYPITELVNLRSLELPSDRGMWHDVASLLQILPARLRRLVFVVEARIEGDIPVGIEDDGLELLEPILEKTQFAGLTTVEFSVYGYYLDRPEISFAPPELKVAEIVRQKLPKLHARGVVGIHVDDLVGFVVGYSQ
ncbi:hypothetical protein C8Q80DRAFT_1265625 [Daedaleopsis nitida]|nr:hypothetical protein C8Q80DRAFT_1265625 [Daedaleopsis nitida]